VRPSSSTSEPEPGGLFDGVLARGRVREAVGDRAWLQALLDVEAGLARAEARAGLISPKDAAAIANACRADAFDPSAIGTAAAEGGNPVIPLVRELTAAVGGSTSAHVHHGATSQDVLDTATMLVARRTLEPLLGDLRTGADAAAELAATHRATVMAGRTLLQHALPTTFGLKAAVWLTMLDQAGARLAEVGPRLPVQLGGAAGTLASLGDSGAAVQRLLAEDLGLAVPIVPWHTDRTPVADLAGALGTAAGGVGKIAGDVVLLAQTEVGEVREGTPGRGGSSTLPQKHNPIAAVSAVACAQQAPGLVSTLLASMQHEHERAAGAWHAEWRPLSELLRSTGSAVAWLSDCLAHLVVDAARMRANLDLTGGLLLAERISGALAGAVGPLAAHDLVESIATASVSEGRPFEQALQSSREVREHLSSEEITSLLDPAGYLGSSDAFVSRALEAHASIRGTPS